ncbi:DUF433 domain-containing protein [Acidithiobacillus ferrooxidans]|uniref:DUF433 domain-containing protein n=1 Tax=Acidithiobacillus ferrooxidans (strain ATCC 23270 / DSM 14882 / CIP 104768 / NCIMB 8455) TaxID=243159 RepID=B7J9H1_ACIF2|nr:MULTISPECIES: DUF433 domain-containing protein [Acidithiobacillus]ACK80648.1 conserved hypothetical protein [Acidithiobacillus ferrooxidans ATCC 23270]MBN6745745.1 DUF433 domain-containing protein [Acidithiobacillus sp. MC2.2]MBN6749206.1 DUF433 domain-containing protein [Acidithiobacillus sp. PG05]
MLDKRITIDPSICHGKPCIRGLRYPIEDILEWLASGMSIEEILADYEDLERADILASLDYAARLAQIKRVDRLVS